MILSLRHIRRRIRSVENTKKMTHAMELVAAAKLKRLQESLKQSDRYIGELKRILGTLVREIPLAHPLLENRTETKSILVFLIASDTGLCGSYNTNILSEADRFLKIEGFDETVHFAAIGRHGAAYLARAKQPVSKALGIPKPDGIDRTIYEIAQIATDEFIKGEADRVIFIYTHVVSLSTLRPACAQLFPIVSHENQTPAPGRAVERQVDYLVEPALDQVLEIMLPEFIEAEVGQFLKHSLVAEQVSRMLAMRQATDNAKEMIDSLTLLRNKARQAAITKELLEVVSGSRALQMK